jgi:hypothetical protein
VFLTRRNDGRKLRRTAGFFQFAEDLNCAYQERLARLRITPYRLTDLRAIEASAFELASNDDDGA